jgi:hypothetical protein
VDGLDHQRNKLGQLRAAFYIYVADEGAYPNVAVVLFDVGETRQATDINYEGGLGEPQLEQGDEALPAGHDLGVISALLQDGKGLA